MNENEYDFIVIGGGSAGFAAARTAVEQGLKTAVVEGGEEVGGLCILRGCMPSKTLLESARRAEVIRHSAEYGLQGELQGVDGRRIQERKKTLIADFAGYRKEQLETGKFDFLRGRAKFLTEHKLSVALREGGTRELSAKAFLVATGSRVNLVEISGLAETGYMDSDHMLEAEYIPESVIVLGGGAIAVEAATYYAGLGKRVSLVQRSKCLVKEMDSDVSDALASAFREQGIEVFTDTELLRVERTGQGKCVHIRQGGLERAVVGEEIIYALGRRPNTDGLGLDELGVKRNKRCSIVVDCSQRSSVPHLFAAGDACGPYEVVHIAIQQAEVAAKNAANLLQGGKKPMIEMDYSLKLFAVFSQPEAASVGLTGQEASDLGIPFLQACYPFADHGKAMVRGETQGFVKLIADQATRRIIGGSVVGPEASELIHEIAVAMAFKATAGQLAQVPHYHPTLSEIWTYPAEALACADCSE